MPGVRSKKSGQPNGKGGKSSKKKTQIAERKTVQLSSIISSRSLQSHTSSLHVNSSYSHQPNSKVNRSQPCNNVVPPIIPSQLLHSHTSPITIVPPIIQSQLLHSHTSPIHISGSPLPLGINQPQPANIESQPQSNQPQPTNHEPEPVMSRPANRTPAISSSIVDNVDDEHQIWIVPEEDGFDPHKVVIDGIASCICSKFELAKPSWKKYPRSIHEIWFEEFKKIFKWLLHHNDAIWSNFNKRASSKMTQLFQDVRKDLPLKPQWMGDAVFKEMKEHWESYEFKKKSEQNKRNHDSNACASLHTGGCVPHRVIYKRMVIRNYFKYISFQKIILYSAFITYISVFEYRKKLLTRTFSFRILFSNSSQEKL